MRGFLLSAASVAAILCACGPAAAQGGSSTGTITQSGPNGTSSVTRSTNGSQTITRQSGNSSATITQGSGTGGSGGGKTAADAEANRAMEDIKDEAAARLGCGTGGSGSAGSAAGKGATSDGGPTATVPGSAAAAGAMAGIDVCATVAPDGKAAQGKAGAGGSGAGSSATSPAPPVTPPKPTPAPDQRSDAATALERRMDPTGRLPALDARVERETGRSLGAAQSLREIVGQATR